MTVVETRARPRPRPRGVAAPGRTLPGRLLLAVICSRMVVLAAGAIGVLFTHPMLGWQQFDGQRLTSHLGSVGNVLAGSSVRWDAVGYIRLAEHGYTSSRSTTLFPMYPLLLRGVMFVVASPVVAGLLISLVSFSIGLVLVHRIASEHIGSRTADAAVLLLAFGPLSFVFSAVYTASLLLACAAGMFYLASRGRFILAAIVASIGALTHVEGVVLVLPLALMYWRSRGHDRSLRDLVSPEALALGLPPLALATFFSYMHWRGWSFLAPITNQNFANTARTLEGPPLVLAQAVGDTVTGLGQAIHGTAPPDGEPWTPGIENLAYLAGFGLAVLSLVSAWRRLPREYTLFALLAILVCTSSAVALEPLKGFDRYMLPVFPLWIGAAAWLDRRRLMPYVLAISTVMLVFNTLEFTRWVSVF